MTYPTGPGPTAYPAELIPTANGVQSYMNPPEDAAEAFAAAQLKVSPVDRIVGAFNALRPHVAALDAEGLAVLASCAQQIVLNGFHGMGAEALTVRDAAIAEMG
jgi:hypothetical protein